MTFDEKLLAFATETQAKYYKAACEHGSGRKAAEALGVTKSTINTSLAALRAKAAASGYAPDNDLSHELPEGFKVKKVSTQYDADGVVKSQWVQAAPDGFAKENSLREFAAYLADEVRNKSEPIELTAEATTEQLVPVYLLGDQHIGMLAWKDETGESFDLEIAERLNVGAFKRLVHCAPASKECLIISVGDLLHADNSTNRTPASGAQLDVDSRYQKIVQVALRVLKRSIDLALTKHETVNVWVLNGNHDPHSSFMISMCLDAFYANNPRVVIDMSPAQYRYRRFGKVLIGGAHGHGAKPAQLPLLMATDQPAAWGQSKFRYWFFGHIHHQTVVEINGVKVESVRSMAGKDAWHAMKGYRAGRDMSCVVMHKLYGETDRYVASAAMIDDMGGE